MEKFREMNGQAQAEARAGLHDAAGGHDPRGHQPPHGAGRHRRADQHRGFKKVIMQLKNDVEGGKQFSEASPSTPSCSTRSTSTWSARRRCPARSAEMLDRIAGYIGQQIETRKMVIGAAIYPAIIGTLAVGVTIFLLTFVLPKFYGGVRGQGGRPALGDEVPDGPVEVHGGELVPLSSAAIWRWCGAIYGVPKTEVGGFWVDKMKLTCPS
jgi:hypothetical protein